MAGYNRVILVGNLTRDPELRYTPQGTAVADLRLAVTESRGGKGSEKKEETLFIDVTVWERQAETCSEYLSKGRSVLVEGRLVLDEWQDKETSEKRSKIRVVANTVRFLGSRSDAPEGGGPPAKKRPAARAPAEDAGLEAEPQEGGSDVPF